MLLMAERQILPAVLEYQGMVADTAHKLFQMGVIGTGKSIQTDLLNKINKVLKDFSEGIKALKSDIDKLENSQ